MKNHDFEVSSLRRFHAAAARQQLPKVVKPACKTTKPLRESALSKICQVIAAIALVKLGSIARANHVIAFWFEVLAYLEIKAMAIIHSNKVAMWISQVPVERACT